eukprot:scaffold118665_cov30-Tisochrysis_lutea.AAC.1
MSLAAPPDTVAANLSPKPALGMASHYNTCIWHNARTQLPTQTPNRTRKLKHGTRQTSVQTIQNRARYHPAKNALTSAKDIPELKAMNQTPYAL